MPQIAADTAHAADVTTLPGWHSLAPGRYRAPSESLLTEVPVGSLSQSWLPRIRRALADLPEVGKLRLEPALAHDLNNLLTSIIGHTDLARRKLTQGATPREHLEQIEAAVARARKLLAYQRGEKRPALRKPLAPLQTVIHEAAELIRATLPANVQLRLQIDEAAPAIALEDDQIHRMILNLARNAIQAMERRGGELEITLECLSPNNPQHRLPPGRYLRFGARDTGEGMTSETLKRVCEPGFTTRPGRGSGWGLANVARIVQDHGAIMRVDSQPGQGSCFHVFFSVDH
ncbi:MAG: ATP-binding protein [Acidobacteriota bacterium]